MNVTSEYHVVVVHRRALPLMSSENFQLFARVLDLDGPARQRSVGPKYGQFILCLVDAVQ